MKNVALSLSLLESEITRLYIIQQSISGFADSLEIAIPSGSESGWGLDRALALVAKAMEPDLTDEEMATCARLPVFNLAAKTAANTTFSLLAALRVARGAPKVKSRVSADVLIEAARKKRTGEYEDREAFINHLPWLIQSALDYFCSDSDYDPKLNSGSAIGMRLLASILDAMEAHGLESITPEDESEGSAKGKVIREEQGRYRLTTGPGINSIIRGITWGHPSLN